MLLEGGSIEDVIDEQPGFAMMNKKKIEDFAAFAKAIQRKNLLRDWETDMLPRLNEPPDNPEDGEIFAWCASNINRPRLFKQKQLYIYAPSNYNKTSFIQQLSLYVRVYHCCPEEFFDGYSDELYDLIVIDEFVGGRNLQTMNQLLDGQACRLRIKGGQVEKSKNLPVIILSNLSASSCYLHTNLQDTFLNRVIEIIPKKPIKLFF